MRPVVSSVSAPTHELSDYLDIWFKQITKFQQNSLELSELLTHNPPPPESIIFISFDLLRLFPHILLQPTVDHIDELLAEAEVSPPSIEEFKAFLNLCLAPNVCQFYNSVYRLPTDIGIPVGSP